MLYLRQKAMHNEHGHQETTLGHSSSRGRQPALLGSSAGPPGAHFIPVFIPALTGAPGPRCDAGGGLRSCVGARLPARPSSSFALVTKPEYFRRNCLKDLGATIRTSQLRGFLCSAVSRQKSGEENQQRNRMPSNSVSKIHLRPEITRHFSATLLT